MIVIIGGRRCPRADGSWPGGEMSGCAQLASVLFRRASTIFPDSVGLPRASTNIAWNMSAEYEIASV